MNLAAVGSLCEKFEPLDCVFIESGGDNLSATFSPELSDLTIYVIDVSAGDKIPRKGGPGITKSDLLIINKVDLAPIVGASLDVMERPVGYPLVIVLLFLARPINNYSSNRRRAHRALDARHNSAKRSAHRGNTWPVAGRL